MHVFVQYSAFSAEKRAIYHIVQLAGAKEQSRFSFSLCCDSSLCVCSPPAMCLYTVTEDNPPSHHILTSSPSHMALLETLLHAPPPSSPTDHPLDQKHSVVLSTVAAGIPYVILRTSVNNEVKAK